MMIEELRAALEYDAISGELIWKHRDNMPACVNWMAGTVVRSTPHNNGSGNSYLRVCVNRKHYFFHRVAWMLAHGEIPDGCVIDHIDGDGTNNRLSNLRVVPHVINSRNQKRSKNCKSGVMGVTWAPVKNKWLARISSGKHRKFLGLFDQFEDAVAARKRAERELGYHINHGIRT
jgi:hypothetical protein